MDFKTLIGIVGRPWLIEPTQAAYWSEAVNRFISTGTMPVVDKRDFYQGLDTGSVFRVNDDGVLNNNSGSIQVFRMDAPVAKYDYCGAPGSQTWIQHLAAANADDGIKSIVLWIDSPGGQVDGTEDLGTAIRNSSKPVVTFCGSMMCSGSLWIGSSATEVYADGANNGWNATIGSIGTMATFRRPKTAKRDENGVATMESDTESLLLVFADASSDKWGDYFSVLGGDVTRIKEELNGINDTFLAAVRNNRPGVSEEALTGKTFNAKEALKMGLIDKIGTFTDAVKRASQLAKSQKKTTTTMSKNNASFQNVMTAVAAEEIPVVEGGFLMTEDQLNKIDASMAAFAQAATDAAATIKDLNAKLEAATAAEASLKEKLAAAETKVADLQAASAQFFGKQTADKQDPEQHEAPDASQNYAHIQEAYELL